ncbi:hypothetical protein ABZZ44_11090 [Streptomyces sp. NPDC006460]|uniref:hypothetical protein n=1 Tax=Streptomyces sp. NPDC006460 TaxID=3154304 RepID=UPI0033AAD41D
MDDNAEQQQPSTGNRAAIVAPSYAVDQWAKALTTALAHDDAGTRRRAAERGRRWQAVLEGIREGRLTIGSRTPVSGLPAWVTPEVVRGGFATGSASAAGPLLPHERDTARRFGLPVTREALFAHHLTEPGLRELADLLDSGRYEVTVPEEAALLTVAWLARAGEVDAAVALAGELAPHARELRFFPRPSEVRLGGAGNVSRRTVAEARESLDRRRPHDAVETQREALTVWNPFADRVLAHWLATTDASGRVLERCPDERWYRAGAELLAEYRRLADAHTRCRKHRDPKGNLGILIGALRESVARRPLEARRLGLLRTAVAAMVRRRGEPGSARHAALRREQAAQGALPSHHAFARLARHRLAGLPHEGGASDVAPLVADVSAREAREWDLPAGARLAAPVRRIVEGTLEAPLGTLVERGLVPSAEVLAELLPQLVAATTARTYAGDTLPTLMAANYRAFRRRRSLLLLNLEHQVRVEELPWVRAVDGHRNDGPDGGRAARELLRELGETAVRAFPGTLLPNVLVRELSVLARQADLGAPLVEELAADIFTGGFSPKFPAAARVAAELLGGTLYERYYGIDYAAVRNLAVLEASRNLLRSRPSRTSPEFDALCARRAGNPGSWSVAGNGKVIEQAQILTTHNLATLVARVGVTPGPGSVRGGPRDAPGAHGGRGTEDGWAVLALRGFDLVCRLTARLDGPARARATVKDAAYAWRQMLFHLSLSGPATRALVPDLLAEEASRRSPRVAERLAPALAGLRFVADGGSFGPDGTALDGAARRLLGWSTEAHWLLAPPAGASR